MIGRERVTLNPVTEDATLAPLDLVGLDQHWGIYLLGHDYPPPKPEVVRSGSADTEGEGVVSTKWGNRTLSCKLRLVEPEDPAATNMLRNPSAELNATFFNLGKVSWTEGAMNREAIPAAVGNFWNSGDYALHLTGKKDNTATQRNLSIAQSTAVGTVTPGRKYSFGANVYVIDNANTGFQVRIDWYDAASVFISASAASALYVPATGPAEARLSIANQAAPANASFATVVLIGFSSLANDTVNLWTDGWQLEEGEVATAYFDGDTPGCDWTGARHASTSTRPAPDGTRFSRIYRDVMGQLDRLKREKVGTYRRVPPGFSPVTYDTRSVEVTDAPQDLSLGMKRAEIGLAFEALPGGRGPEIQVGANFDETSLPALIFLAENIPGDMPALGRLLLEDRQGQAQLAAWWGEQSVNYSASADAALLYEAETRQLYSGSVAEALAGSSGAEGKAVKSTTLVNSWQTVLSTQAAGGNHMAHVGSYRVLARVYRPLIALGALSLKFTWTEGDFLNINENDTTTWNWTEGPVNQFAVVDLGIIDIAEAPSGSTQRWEGRIMAKGTGTNERIYIDCLMLIPISEGSGEVVINPANQPPPAALSAFDSFKQSAGALAGKAAEIGGSWSGAGDADDFAVEGAGFERVIRTAVSDVSGTPRYELLGATNYTDIAARVNVWSSNPTTALSTWQGLLLRYVDVNNWVALLFFVNSTVGGTQGYVPRLYKKVAGVKSSLTLSPVVVSAPAGTAIPPTTLEMLCLSSGFWQYGVNGITMASGSDTDFSSTGALKQGRIGLFDEKVNATAETRYYDTFEAWVPSIDAAIFANRQLEIRADQARRQDATGLTWGKPPYEGDYLLVPQSGPEKRVTRFIAKASRNPNADAGIDDLRGKLFVTPRYLMAPST